MKCLTSAQVQAVVDGEAPPHDVAHAASCGRCREEVVARRSQVAGLTAAIDALEMPGSSALRVDAAIARGGASGATRLRTLPRAASWRNAAWGTAAVAAATLAAIVFVAPMMKEDRGTVSAAEVLAASARSLSQSIANGVEVLEYELTLDGVPKDLMPDHANGSYRVRQAIDHGTPGRFRYASYDPSGRPYSSLGQDPVTGRRVMMFTLEGQPYRFEMTVPAGIGMSVPEMERLHMEATIGMMQASGDQLLEVVDTPDGRQYRIEVPKAQASIVSPVWDLEEARVLIDAADYRVTELAVKGMFLKQPYSVTYRLISRQVHANVPADTFDVPPQPGEIVVAGEGSIMPARDAVVLALKEVARLTRLRQ